MASIVRLLFDLAGLPGWMAHFFAKAFALVHAVTSSAASSKWATVGWGAARKAVAWTSQHSGIPAVVVAAVAIVILYRLAQRTARLVAEISIVLAVLLVLTTLGIVRF